MKTMEDVSCISVADRRLLDDLKSVIRQHLPNATVLLYGSVARGDKKPDSDYDVLVLIDKKMGRQQEDAVRDAVYQLELTNEVLVTIIFCPRDKWDAPVVRVSPFRQEVEKDAIAL